jgi:NADH-quinone oxidoreductase subunit M
MTAMLAMMVALLWLGVYPQPVLDLAQPVLDGLHGLLQHSELLAGVGQ